MIEGNLPTKDFRKFDYQDGARAILERLFDGRTDDFEDHLEAASGGPGHVSLFGVKPLNPGLSGAAVFMVRRIGASGGVLTPWLVKASNQSGLIKSERENWTIVKEIVPSVPLLTHAYGTRFLIFAFGGPLANVNPETLRSGYAKSGLSSLETLMSRLVGDLKPIQDIVDDSFSCLDRMPLLKDFVALSAGLTKLLPLNLSQRLIEAWKTTIKSQHRVPNVRSKAHGDLNSGNILFQPGDAASIAVVIDWASMARSKDNTLYDPYFHFPFWDYAKLERDLQTRLFLQEAVEAGLSNDTIIHTIQELNTFVDPSHELLQLPVVKLIRTTTSLRKAISKFWAPDYIRGCYKIVLAYAMLSMLFRPQPDDEFPQGLQNIIAAEAAIALLSNPFGEFLFLETSQNQRLLRNAHHNYNATLRLGLLRTDDSEFERALFYGAKAAISRFRQKYSALKMEVIESAPTFRQLSKISDAMLGFKGAEITAVLGPCDSESAQQLLLSQILDETPIPLISPGASSPLLQQQPYTHPFFFRATSSDRDNLEDLVDWLLHSPEHHPALVISEASETNDQGPLYGESLRDVFDSIAETKDLPTQRGLVYKRGQSNALFGTIAKRLEQDDRPRSVILFGLSRDMLNLACEIRFLVPEIALYVINPRRELFLAPNTSYGCREPSVVAGLRAVFDSSAEMVERAPAEHFRRAFQKVAPDELRNLDGTGMFGHDAAQIILVRALEITNPAQLGIEECRKQLAKRLRTSLNVIQDCLLSHGRFDESQELVLTTKRFVIKNGKFEHVIS